MTQDHTLMYPIKSNHLIPPQYMNQMVQYEMVLELREFLSEYVFTCFVTHYYFEHKGRRLNDYTELEELDLHDDPRIYMRREKYDEKNARFHIRRVIEILTNPPVLSGSSDQPQQHQKISQTHPSNNDYDEKKQGENCKQDQDSKQQSSSQSTTTSTPITKQPSEYEERLKKNYEEFMGIIEKESKKEVPLPQKNNYSLLRDLFKNPIELEMNKVQQIKCIENISFSSFNPVPANRRMLGELFYLHIKTLDNGDHGVTCCVNGFYKNDNVEKQVFSPGPSSKFSPCFSYTLVECLILLSPAFGQNLEKYINSILATEPYCLTQPQQPCHYWICMEQQLTQVRFLIQNKNESATLTPLFGLDPKGIRDWNEEFQVVKDFPKDTFLQRIQRDRAINKVYNDFVYAAVGGAMAIINRNLMPLNPNEGEKQQVFVYNYIFFSYAIDLIESFRDLTSTENNPSFTQANHDLNGLRTLQILDIEGLHLLATCLVNFRGQRIIAQSIIPGILNNNDLASLAEYGSVDEQKTINANEEFHSMMKKVCEQLNIKIVRVIDGNGKEVEIAGSLEVKGIKGTDKRNYLVDLQGLQPRDWNYQGEEHHACLLRPELLQIYQRQKSIEYAQRNMMQHLQKQVEEQKSESANESGEVREETKEEDPTISKTEINIKKLRDFDRFIKEAPRCTFNTNVFKNIKFSMEDQEIRDDEKLIENVSLFLNEQAIPKLIRDLQNSEGVPTDSESMEQAFHSHGVNMRYMGEVARQLGDRELPFLRSMIEREVVFRSAKHIFNQHIREASDTYLSSVICHLLNIFLAPFPFLDKLNEGVITYVDKTLQHIVKEHHERIFADELRQVSSQSNQSYRSHSNSLDDSSFYEESKQPTPQTHQQQHQQPAHQRKISKNEKKKNKKKKNQQLNQTQEYGNQNSQQQTPEQQNEINTEFSDMLLKQSQDPQYFTINELFKDRNTIAKGFIHVEKPNTLQMKPYEFYNRIREIALVRYQYRLPEHQTELKCLQQSNNKISLLRDLCVKLGIKINSHQHKDYILDNHINILFNRISQQILNEIKMIQIQNENRQSKILEMTWQQPPLNIPQSLDDLWTYYNLPFQVRDVLEIFPVIKFLELQNNDVRQMQSQAKQAFKEGNYERAFELYSQCINALLQITGPMNKEVAFCISQLANIQYKFGDFLQAIELQTKCIILQERILGYDHALTAQSYCNLAMYHHSCGYFTKGFEHMYRAITLLKVVCGENHPEISGIYQNLGLMYLEVDHYQAAIDCFMEALYRNISLFGENHIQVPSCYQAIAQAYFQLTDYRKALEFQEKAHKILIRILPPEDHYVKNSLAQMDQFMKLTIYMERVKAQEKNQRQIGSNKPNKEFIPQKLGGQGGSTGAGGSNGSFRRANFRQGALFQRLGRGGKNNNFIDLLEYTQFKEQQILAQKLLKEQLDMNDKNKAEEDIKQSSQINKPQ